MKRDLPYRPDPKPTYSQWRRQKAREETNRASLIIWGGGLLVLGSLFWPYVAWHGTQATYPYNWTWTATSEIAEGAWIGFWLVLALVLALVWAVRAVRRGWPRLSLGWLGVLLRTVSARPGLLLVWVAMIVVMLVLLLHIR